MTTNSLWARGAALLMLVAGCWRIAATHDVFSPTFDEMFHLACGLEWWEEGAYTIEPQHPPLSRIVAAAGPYFAGGRRIVMSEPSQQGWSVLDQLGLKRGLALDRRGNLVFFVLLCITVWGWTRRLGGEWAAALAVLFLTCLPPLLGHAGLGTTDLAVAATLPLALWCALDWWQRRTLTSAACAGAAAALMIGSKYSALLFFPAALLGAMLAGWKTGLRPARCWKQWALAGAAALFVLFAIFHFRPQSPKEANWPRPEPGSLSARFYETPLPLMQIAAGVRQVAEHSGQGHDAYLWGEHRTRGWWYFFPVVFGIKTPLAFLGLIALAVWTLAGRRPEDDALALPLAAAVCIMLSVLPTTINIGIRHILPLYPLLAVPAAVAAWRWLAGGGWRAAVSAALILGLAGASVQAAPDYMADFNLLAGPRPEAVRVDSDLDWGQDLFRLVERCRERNIRALNMAVLGYADLEMLGLPYAYVTPPRTPTSGWFAIGVTERQVRNAMNQGYRWLDAYQPVERIGETIDLYRIENSQWPDRAGGFNFPPNYGLAEFPARTPVAHIAPPLQADLMGGNTRIWSQYGFESGGDGGFCWLGRGNPGLRISLWARRALRVILTAEASPGPMRRDNVRHLQAIVNGEEGDLIQFEGDARLSWPAQLRPGFNLVQFRTTDPPQIKRLESGETRQLVLRVRRIEIGPE